MIELLFGIALQEQEYWGITEVFCAGVAAALPFKAPTVSQLFQKALLDLCSSRDFFFNSEKQLRTNLRMLGWCIACASGTSLRFSTSWRVYVDPPSEPHLSVVKFLRFHQMCCHGSRHTHGYLESLLHVSIIPSFISDIPACCVSQNTVILLVISNTILRITLFMEWGFFLGEVFLKISNPKDLLFPNW